MTDLEFEARSLIEEYSNNKRISIEQYRAFSSEIVQATYPANPPGFTKELLGEIILDIKKAIAE